ncbi:MAG: PAS domain-containing protein [Fibromonadales bacterium]|nr:PAS domain-containing protein [Fibromonadales bacterium]
MSKLIAWSEENLASSEFAITSDNFYDMLGYSKAEFGRKRKEWISKVASEDQVKLLDASKNEVWEVDFRLIQKDNSVIWLRETGRLTPAEDGKLTKVSLIVKNITIEKKSLERAESKERENARISKEIIDMCPVAMALFQIKGGGAKLLEANEVCLRMWNFNSYQDAAEHFVNVVSDSIPPCQPNGTKSIPLSERFVTVMKEGSVEFQTFLRIKDKDRNAKICIKKIELPEKILAITYIMPE